MGLIVVGIFDVYKNSLWMVVMVVFGGMIVVFGGVYLIEKICGVCWLCGFISLCVILLMGVLGFVFGISYIFLFNVFGNLLNGLYGLLWLFVIVMVVYYYVLSYFIVVIVFW